MVALASETETIRSYDGIEVTRDGLWRAAREGALAKNDVYDGVGHVSSSAECLDTLVSLQPKTAVSTTMAHGRRASSAATCSSKRF